MSTFDVSLETSVEDLAPMRMPTETLSEIDQLSRERRGLLRDLAVQPSQFAVKHRLETVDHRLEKLWEQRRYELRHKG